MSSNVTNISKDEIVCLLFDKNLDVISEVTHHEQPLSFKHEAVEIYAAGCGVHRALINSQNVEREVGPFIAGLCNGFQCIFSLLTVCTWTTGLTYHCPENEEVTRR